eukprot:SAG22_NODE_478_length_9967_cov_12.777260_9_plen_244_part_00
MSVVSPFRDDSVGWEFRTDANAASLERFVGLPVTADASPLQGKTLLDVYLASTPDYTGNITTPTLYDARSNQIVSDDSFGMMRTFVQTVPEELGHLYLGDPDVVDREGRMIDAELGQRVYMCGLAKTQEAYEAALARVFAELDRLEERLRQQAAHGSGRLVHALGLTLADIHLAACLFRFDSVYFGLFKCYTRRIASYTMMAPYLRAVADEIGPEALALDMPQILSHYYSNFVYANSNGVIPT